jgi:PAS domain S-box-containing protein
MRPGAVDGEAPRSWDRLDLVLEAGGMGTWDWDLRADHIQWDERTAAIFGVRLEDFDGSLETFNTLVHPDDRDALNAAIQEAIATRGTFRREYRVALGNDVRWVSVRGRVLVGDDGQPDSMVGVAQDRTDTHSQGERLARTLEAIDEAFYSVDRSWRFTYVNTRAEELLQRPRSELLGQDVWELFPAAVDTPFQDHYERAMHEGTPQTFEEHYAPLGLWVEVRAYPDADGIAVYFRDITERRQRQQAQEAKAAREQVAHRAAGRLLSSAELLRADQPPAETAATACRIGRATFDCSRVAVWEAQSDTAVLLAQDGGNPLPIGSRMAVEDLVGLRSAMGSGRPTFVPDVADMPSSVRRDVAERVGARSLVQAPVELGASAGTLVAVLSWDRTVEEPDQTLLDVIGRFAQQSALAIEQSRRRKAQVEAGRLSAQLQASLLPNSAVLSGTLDVATLYQPGERRMLLGGDFYDVAEHADGTVSAVIGDVTGHGPEAAAIGATLRAGWRTLALTGCGPKEIVPALDELLRSERHTDEQLVSVLCAQLDGSVLTLASAGHPPPILVTDVGTELLEEAEGLLLGMPLDSAWGTTRIELPERWALLLYTDGLPEARLAPGSSERLGLERFTAYVAATKPLAASGLDSALRRLQRDARAQAGEAIEDDVALLLLRSREGAGQAEPT